MASGPHLSKPRNLLIAETFHGTGTVEIWGRDTNRVIDECEAYGGETPTFGEQGGAPIVTFRAAIGPIPQAVAVLQAAGTPRSRNELQKAAGLKDREHFRRNYLEPFLTNRWLKMTIPEKPRSSRQRCVITETGRKHLDD